MKTKLFRYFSLLLWRSLQNLHVAVGRKITTFFAACAHTLFSPFHRKSAFIKGVDTKASMVLACMLLWLPLSNTALAGKPGLSPPTSLSATVISVNQVELRWQDPNKGESGYAIERAQISSGPFTQVAETGSDATAYSDQGLTGGTYYYRVRAFKDSRKRTQYSIYSSTTSAQIGDTTPPSVSISSNPADAVHTSVQTVVIQANASDDTGISHVEFFKNGTLIHSDSSAPYGYEWYVDANSNGSHTWTARAYDTAGNSNTSAPLNGTVDIDVMPLTVAITSPDNGMIYTESAIVAITVSATDNKGVESVEFYRNDTLVFTATDAPFIFDWTFTDANNGEHTWTAKAIDLADNTALSDPVTVNVNIDATPPTVSLTNPTDGSTYVEPGTLMVAADATDNVGVTKVEFFDNGALIHTDQSSPYEFDWTYDEKDNGEHACTARAYDAAGNSSESDQILITVAIDNSDTTPPTVAITSPADSTTYTEPATVTITASADDDVGVSEVEFYLNGTMIYSDTQAPFAVDWSVDETDNGQHIWTAKAYDTAGNSATSGERTLFVNIPSLASYTDALITDIGRLGPNSEIEIKGRMAEYGDITAMIYGDSLGTIEKWVYMRDGRGNESRIFLPGLTDDLLFNAEYILTSPNELWIFSSDGFPAFGREGAPPVMRQYQLSGSPLPNTATLVSSRSFGDTSSLAGSLIKLKSGALVAAWLRETDDGLTGELHLVYRSPTGIWSELPPQYIDYYRNHLNRVTLVQHPADDSIWLFTKADSFSEIWAFHLSENSGTIQLDWMDENFISEDIDGAIGPEGELPDLIAVPNPYDNTLLLAYQNEYDQWFYRDGKPISKGAFVTIAKIKGDGSKTFTIFDTYVERALGLNGLIVRPDKIILVYKPIDMGDFTWGDVYITTYADGLWGSPEFIGSAFSQDETVAYGRQRAEIGIVREDYSIHFLSLE